jgi:hypothetical protein
MAKLNDREREELIAYLDGELPETEASAVEARLSLDAEVKKEAEALRKTWELLDYLPKPEPSPSFTNRTMERISAQATGLVRKHPIIRRRSRWTVGLGWAAAALIAAGAGFGITTVLTGHRTPLGEQAQKNKDDPLADMSAPDIQRGLALNLRILENQRLYENVDDIELLRALDNADLFGEED